MGRVRIDRATPSGWGVWLRRQGLARERGAPRPPVAGASSPYARDAFPLGELPCLRGPASRPWSRPGEEEGVGPPRSVWPG